MHKFIVAGSGTGVGKTVVSAILTKLLSGDYWKPIQCGLEEKSDTNIIKSLVDTNKHQVHQPSFSLKAPLSPHQAAKLENTYIDLNKITLPRHVRPLIIETVGGIFTPLTSNFLSVDLFKSWNGPWIVVSRHYLGSINHTLLTLFALKEKKVPILGIIFNGHLNPESEKVILEISQVPFLGRVLFEERINAETIQKYSGLWQPLISKFLP